MAPCTLVVTTTNQYNGAICLTKQTTFILAISPHRIDRGKPIGQMLPLFKGFMLSQAIRDTLTGLSSAVRF